MYPSKFEIFSSAMSDDLLGTIMSQEYIIEGGACSDRTEYCCFMLSFLELLKVQEEFIDFSEVIQDWKLLNSVFCEIVSISRGSSFHAVPSDKERNIHVFKCKGCLKGNETGSAAQM